MTGLPVLPATNAELLRVTAPVQPDAYPDPAAPPAPVKWAGSERVLADQVVDTRTGRGRSDLIERTVIHLDARTAPDVARGDSLTIRLDTALISQARRVKTITAYAGIELVAIICEAE